ncbi:hypothetical protein VE00_04140 [Pseudogymnoascus sp. WSF 3629]|nr:hypothetical protein VE00_04140 [Pseudogymnoascus sp. WSF 3629]
MGFRVARGFVPQSLLLQDASMFQDASVSQEVVRMTSSTARRFRSARGSVSHAASMARGFDSFSCYKRFSYNKSIPCHGLLPAAKPSMPSTARGFGAQEASMARGFVS